MNMKDIFWAGKDKKDKDSPPISANSDKNNVVETTNNRIYYYSEVSRQKILILNKNLKTLNDNLLNQAQLLDLKEPANIYLHVNS